RFRDIPDAQHVTVAQVPVRQTDTPWRPVPRLRSCALRTAALLSCLIDGFMSRYIVAPVIALLGVAPSAPVLAQQQPDTGSLLREFQRPMPARRPEAVEPVHSEPAAKPVQGEGVAVQVSAFQITGAKLVPQAELLAAVAGFTNRSLSFADLQRAADAVAQVYRSKGYLVRAYLPEQTLSQGGTVQ